MRLCTKSNAAIIEFNNIHFQPSRSHTRRWNIKNTQNEKHRRPVPLNLMNGFLNALQRLMIFHHIILLAFDFDFYTDFFLFFALFLFTNLASYTVYPLSVDFRLLLLRLHRFIWLKFRSLWQEDYFVSMVFLCIDFIISGLDSYI